MDIHAAWYWVDTMKKTSTVIITSSQYYHSVIECHPVTWGLGYHSSMGLKVFGYILFCFAFLMYIWGIINHLLFETIRRDLKNELYLPSPKINVIYSVLVANIENSKDLIALEKVLLNINIKYTIPIYFE